MKMLTLKVATTIGYDSGYLNGVLGSADFVSRYGELEADGVTMYLTPYTRSTFSSLLVVGTVIGSMATALVTNRSESSSN